MTNEIGYRKEYNIRRARQDGSRTLEVTFPYEVVEKEARSKGMTVDEFIERFRVAAEYNGFDGIRYTFIERDETEQPR